TWMGICHGWTPASFNIPRPRTKVLVKSADGKLSIPFYPADVRALSSVLWANADQPSRFMGGRCNDKNPQQDPNGRIMSADCRDVNPASWHRAIVNSVGIAKRAFVLDVTWDYEVWNQPIYSYEYSYFNPQTNQPVGTLKEATVARSAFTSDKFAKYRSPGTAFVVGI